MAIEIGTKWDDSLVLGNGNDLIIALGGDDFIDGGGGNDVIVAGGGNDSIFGGDGRDVIIAGGGNDVVSGGGDADLIIADGGDDTVDGGAGDDIIIAGGGDDLLIGGAGNDDINGGGGVDTAVFDGAVQGYTFSFAGNLVFVTELATGETDELKYVEFMSFDNATLVVDADNNAPILDDISIEVSEGTLAIVDNLFVLGNAFDAEGDELTVIGVNGNPANVGTQIVLASGALLTIGVDGALSYDPNGQFDGLRDGDTVVESITFDVTDAANLVTAIAEFTIIGENDAPVAQNVIYEVNEDDAPPYFGGFAFPPPFGQFAFDADDADADDDPSTLEYHGNGILEPPFFSTIPNTSTDFVNDLDGTVHLILGVDWHATPLGETKDFTRTYTATDSHGAVSNEAEITIRMVGANDAPARPQGIFADSIPFEDSGLITKSYRVTDPDSDDGPASLTYELISAPVFEGNVIEIIDNGNGTYSFDTDGVFDSLGEFESFDADLVFTATDSHGATTAFTNGFTVTGLNDAPVFTTPLPEAAALQVPPEFVGSNGEILLTVGDNLALTGLAEFVDDVDSDVLSLEAMLDDGSALPDWLAFDPGAGTLGGTPGAGDVGAIVIALAVNDGLATTTDEFTVIVQGPPAV